jgi:ferric-chelate reductase
MLLDIAEMAAGSSLDLNITIFLSCLCHPETVPPIPESIRVVTDTRPDVHHLLARMLSPTPEVNDVDDESGEMDKHVVGQGGVGMCASGPDSLTREAANAVARLAPMHAKRVGGIALHTEVFSL